MNCRQTNIRFRLAVAALLISCAARGAGAADEQLTYTLRPKPDTGALEVEVAWATKDRTSSILAASTTYGTVESVPDLIRDVQIEGGTLAARQGASWTISHRKNGEFRCRYTVRCNKRELDWSHTHHPIAGRRFFHGVGSAFLLVPGGAQGKEEFEVALRWELPKDWKAVCSWGSGRHLGAKIRASDLRHSVYLAGLLQIREAKPGEKPELTVAVVDGAGFDLDEFTRMATEIISQQCAFMDEKEFPPFVITVSPVGEPLKAGDAHLVGMGLYQSFTLLVAPQSKLTDAVEHLFAHELFHFWNGRILEAEEPDKLVYWLVEGLTDYYSLRILYESGRWDAKTYAKWVNKHIREYFANPARNARNEEIRDRYWKERDTVGEVAYQRGLLLGLRWNRLARDQRVAGGFDAFFRGLVDRARKGGFRVSNGSARQVGTQALGDWFGAEFDNYVTEARTIDVPADALAPEFSGKSTAVYEFSLGFDRQKSLTQKVVIGLEADSAAAKAGLKEGDTLAGWRIPADTSENVKLQVLRDGLPKNIEYAPRGKRSDVLQFQPAATRPGGKRP